MKKWASIAAVLFMSVLFGMNVNAQEGKTADVSLSDALEDVSGEEIEQLIAYIKQKAADGELETEEDIRAAVEEGESRFGVILSEEEIQKIMELMDELDDMGISSENLIAQAEKLYNKYGADIVNQADEVISEAVSSAAKGFWESVKDSVKDFWNNLFH